MAYYFVDDFSNKQENPVATQQEQVKPSFKKTSDNDTCSLDRENIFAFTIFSMVVGLIITLLLNITLECHIPYWCSIVSFTIVGLIMHYSSSRIRLITFAISFALLVFALPSVITITLFGIEAWGYSIVVGIIALIWVYNNIMS